MSDNKVLKPAGNRPKPPAAGMGRRKGTPNKVTREFRETVNALLQKNADNVAIWLEQVATGSHGKEPAPDKALDLLAKLAEYAAPKLGRVEVDHSSKDGTMTPKPAIDASKLSDATLAEILAAQHDRPK